MPGPKRDRPTFQEVIAQQLAANAKLWATLSSHPVLMGSGRERALADTLGTFLPRQFEALDGSIAVPNDTGGHDRAPDQTDLMIVDTLQYPTLSRIGSHSFVLPEAVRAVIEVKTRVTCPPVVENVLKTLRSRQASAPATDDGDDNDDNADDTKQSSRSRSDLLAAIEQLGSLVLLRDALGDVLTVVFSFETSNRKISGLADWLRRIVAVRQRLTEIEDDDAYDPERRGDLAAALSADALPDLIIMLEAGLIAWKDMGEFSQLDGPPEREAMRAYVVEQIEPEDAVALLIVAIMAKLNLEALDARGAQAGGASGDRSPRVIKRADLTKYFGVTWPRTPPEGAVRIAIE